MKRLFLLLTLFFIAIPGILSNVPKPQIIQEKQYLKIIEHQFNRQSFDSCIHFSYILAHKYRKENNQKKLTDVWYSISYLYLLLDRERDAEISKRMAEQYLMAGNHNKTYYEATYQGLYNYRKGNYKRARCFLNPTIPQLPFTNTRLNELVKLYIAYATDHLKSNPTDNPAVSKYLSGLKLANDTNWFGYPLGYFYIGSTYYDANKFNESIVALNCCIDNYERCIILTREWIKAYQSIISDYYRINDNNSHEIYFNRIASKMANTNSLHYLSLGYNLLKADFYSFHSKYQESVDLYLKVYNNSILSNNDQTEIIEGLLFAFHSLENYSKVIEWYQKANPENLYLNDKIIAAYSYFKLGNSKKAGELVSSVEKKISSTNNDYNYTIEWLLFYYQKTHNFGKSDLFYKTYIDYQLAYFGSKCNRTCFAYSQYAYFCWTVKSNYEKALEYYHKAAYALIDIPYNNDYYKLPDISKSINDNSLETELNNKAESFYQLSKQRKSKPEELRDLKASLDNFELSLSLIHKNKINLPREEQQLVYSDLTKRQYPNIIKVCLELYHKTGDKIYADKAFEYAEKSKASLLLSMVQGVNAQHLNLLPEALKIKEDRIQLQTSLISKKRAEEYNHVKPDYNKIDQLNTALLRLNDSQDSLMNTLKTKYKAYYNTKYSGEVTNPTALQKLLAPNEAVLQYSVTWDFMVIYVLTKTEYKIFTDTIGKEFFTDVENYRKRLTTFDYNDVRDTSVYSFAKLSNRLYNHLIKPAEPYISNKKLLVIPDDVLNQVPFESLIAGVPPFSKNIGYKNFDYLIKHHTLNYSFSATLYSLNHGRTTCKNAELLAVAPSYGGIDYKNLLDKSQLNNRSNKLGLSTIASTYDEVSDISKKFSGTELLKTRATEERFKKIAGKFNILHLAMHGVINNESPMFSKLIFSPGHDTINDGFLNTYEIYNMQINAPLVVLSACNTGSGKLHTGEGIISLARGFFTAGAKCVVMTLWSVADKSSSQLMNIFYQNLAKKETVEDALQNAKLTYLDRSDMVFSHPYFWAGYISTGNSEVSFEVKRTHYLYFIIGSAAFILLGSIVWWKKKP